MIFHLRHGQLGNQIFEYIALKKNFPNDKLILLGMTELNELYEIKDLNFLNGRGILIKILRIISKQIESFILKTKIFTIIKENKDSNPIIFKGFFNSIKFSLSDNYFQNQNALSEFKKLKILEKNKNIFFKKNLYLKKKNKTKIFVHIRRTSYINYPSKKYSATLPFSWYKKNIEYMKKKFENIHFYFFSDDTEYLKKKIDLRNSTIITNNYISDYIFMAKCDHAIISASSFSLFAALSNFKKNKVIIAPKYWIGKKKKKWAPKNIKFKEIFYN
tara:strand:+ start:476 stop:1297 length:822 start_codon:yes stop_codon:yes gene_type:complete